MGTGQLSDSKEVVSSSVWSGEDLRPSQLFTTGSVNPLRVHLMEREPCIGF